MRGQSYNSERVFRTDPRGGVTVVQLASYPRGSWNMYFEHNHFTPDGKTVIFMRQRELRPGSPADVCRCDIDGRNMTQLTDEDGVYGIALSRDGHHVYYVHGTTLKRVAMDTFELDEVLHVADAKPGGVGMAGQTGDGRYLFCTMGVADEVGLFRLATEPRRLWPRYRQYPWFVVLLAAQAMKLIHVPLDVPKVDGASEEGKKGPPSRHRSA